MAEDKSMDKKLLSFLYKTQNTLRISVKISKLCALICLNIKILVETTKKKNSAFSKAQQLGEGSS